MRPGCSRRPPAWSRTDLPDRHLDVRAPVRTVETSLLFVLATMWGRSFLFIEVALRAVPPIWIVATRGTVGAAVLLVSLAAMRVRLPRDLRMWRPCCCSA